MLHSCFHVVEECDTEKEMTCVLVGQILQVFATSNLKAQKSKYGMGWIKQKGVKGPVI